jgi:hypothetical protein
VDMRKGGQLGDRLGTKLGRVGSDPAKMEKKWTLRPELKKSLLLK